MCRRWPLPIATIASALLLAGCAGSFSRSQAPPPAAAPAAEPVAKPAEAEPLAPVAPAVSPPPRIAVLDPQDQQRARQRVRQQLAAAHDDAPSGDEAGYYMDVLQARLQQLGSERVGFERHGDHIVLSMPGRLSFDSGSAQLDPGIRATLEAIAQVLVEYRMLLVTVHGHTDGTGPVDVNRRLSEQRAMAVARFLLDAGVRRERLLVVGHGPARPLGSNDTDEGRERNRRVELQLELIAR